MDQIVVADSFTIPDSQWQDRLQNSTSNHIFFTPQWQKAWWQVFGSGYELILVSIFDNHELAGIAPLKRKDNKLSFVGSPDVCDYMDFICASGKEDYFFLRLLDYLEKTEWNTFELDSILPQSLAFKYFIPLVQRRGYLVESKQTNVSPQLILPSSWEEYFGLLTTKNRHELRRKLRRLEQNQSVNYLAITTEEKLNEAMECFFKLFQLSSPEKANFMTVKKREFFTAMAGSLAKNGNIRLSFLEIAGSQASTALCFDYNNDIYLYNSAYDPVYSALSVSLLLEAFCIRDAINNRKTRFDFLSGNEPYKYDLGGQDVPIYHCLISRS
jgi:CelD/BcsL family acetyltransferase involved in cellulose biosynthesis